MAFEEAVRPEIGDAAFEENPAHLAPRGFRLDCRDHARADALRACRGIDRHILDDGEAYPVSDGP